MKMIFFDTETTGLKPGSICQLSYIIVDTSVKPSIIQGKNMFFSVDFVEPSAEQVHGFSVEKLYELSEGQYFEDRLDELIEDIKTADIFIGHNVKFDLKFLAYELEGCGEEFSPKNTFCTMNYYKNICKLNNGQNDWKMPKLKEAVGFLGITDAQIDETSKKYFNDTADFHDARFDTAATYMLVTEGIRRGYIPKSYFSKMVEK